MPTLRSHQDQPDRRRRLPRILLALSAAMVLALCALACGLILTMRNNAWNQAAEASTSLVRSIETAINRDVELYDLSLQAVVEGLQSAELEGIAPEIRQRALFDRSASGRGFGTIFVLDEQGQAYIESRSVVPQRLNAADRPYFQVHRNRNDVGLFIGAPMISAIMHKAVIPLSRRVTYADGSFAGVVVGVIRVDHITAVLEHVATESGTAVGLFLEDGTLLARTAPAAPIGDTAQGRAISGKTAGQRVIRSALDGIERLCTDQRVGQWPLRISVARPVAAIEATWRPKAIAIGLIVLVMCAGVGVLTVWLYRELNRRMEAERAALAASRELACLAATDSLTGLPNRRRFDEALAEARRDAAAVPAALILLDTDQFKRYNDIYGHQAGDQVLRCIGRILQGHARQSGDLACRIGGEEFAVILSGPTVAEAAALAERIRRTVAAKGIPHAGHDHGVVTVSLGVMPLDRSLDLTAEQWFAAADAALYEAKRQGRDQVRVGGSRAGDQAWTAA
ncbi:GGDEF domain-containing protein [Methylobacterium sp. ID0610]|uniref:GGDEF domain-containing protein n=1 Tax=Methylobacterium carpenticola TaxID=3344827 RepID=UPI0036CC55AE